MMQELKEKISRELQKDAASEFKSESYQTFPPESTDDLLQKAQEYVDILNKKYMLK